MNNLKTCPKCNSKLKEGSKFCSSCGYNLESVENEFNSKETDTQLNILYELTGKNDLNPGFISMLSRKNLNEDVGSVIKSKCINLIKNNQFTYENIAIYDVINFEEYSYLLNSIAYWLIVNNKEFKKRDFYEYLGQKEDKQKIINRILSKGKNYTDDYLINKFVECAVLDNKNLLFMPKSMEINGHIFKRKQFPFMIKNVYEYENKYELSPKFIFSSNKKINNPKLDTSFEDNEELRAIIFDKLNLMISAYSIQIKDALKELNHKVEDITSLKFQGLLKLENLDKNTHGVSIKNRLKQHIYNLEITADEVDAKLNEEIKIEVENKKNRLKIKLFEKIGENEIKKSFLEKIAVYDLNKNDAINIKNDMLNKIENNIKESDFDKTLDNILDNHITKKRHQNLVDILLSYISSEKFNNKLKKHHLLDKKQDILSKIQDDILNDNLINEKDIITDIDKYIGILEINDVKSELKKLPTINFDDLLNKYSVSSFLPLKQVKIDKLMDKVDINTLKSDLVYYGVTKYTTPTEDSPDDYVSNKETDDVTPKSTEDNNVNEDGVNSNTTNSNGEKQVCPQCGFENRPSVKFCTNCGIKL